MRPQLILVLAFFAVVSAVDLDRVTSCLVREYNFLAQKPYLTPSGEILECSGYITVNSCWGRCDSSEVKILYF